MSRNKCEGIQFFIIFRRTKEFNFKVIFKVPNFVFRFLGKKILEFCEATKSYTSALFDKLLSTVVKCLCGLKAVSATFLPVCFFKSKREHLSNYKKCFLFYFKTSFRSRENQILKFYIFKFHDVIKCLSIKQEIHFTEQLGK